MTEIGEVRHGGGLACLTGGLQQRLITSVALIIFQNGDAVIPAGFDKASPVHWLAFGLGDRFAPKAPGTVGSAAAILLYLPLASSRWLSTVQSLSWHSWQASGYAAQLRDSLGFMTMAESSGMSSWACGSRWRPSRRPWVECYLAFCCFDCWIL